MLEESKGVSMIAPKRDKLHFSDLQYIYMYNTFIYASVN